MSDLIFDIIAKDQTRAAFEAANNNAKSFSGRVSNAGKDAAKGLDLAKGSVANLAAQFQDIAVQLQGGGSPLTVALQQGTQIGAVLGPMGAGGAVRALGGAFASLISPVNLITIGAIAAGGALYSMLSNAQEEGLMAEDVLAHFNDLVEKIGTTSKSTEERLKSMMSAPATSMSILADAANQISDEQTLIRQKIEEAEKATQTFVTLFATANPYLVDMTSGLSKVNEQLSRGEITAGQALAQLDAMRTAETTPPSLYETIDRLREILSTAAAAEQRLNALSASGVLKGSRVSGPAQANDNAADAGSNADMAARMGDWHENLVDQLNKQTEALKPKAAAMSADERAALRQEKAYQRVTTSLSDELAMIGKSTTDQRILEMQRRAGVDATSAQGQAIANLVVQIDHEKKAFESAQKASKFFHDTFEDSMMQLIPAIDTGNSALDSFINKLIEAAAQAAFFGDGPLGGLFGGGLLSFFGFGGGRAVGGGVEPYTDYLVGENGPEIVRIGARGGSVGSANINGNGQTQTLDGQIRVYVDENGNWQAKVEKLAAAQAQSAVQVGLGQYDRALPARFNDIMERNG